MGGEAQGYVFLKDIQQPSVRSKVFGVSPMILN
jgi:hypothetical protein